MNHKYRVSVRLWNGKERARNVLARNSVAAAEGARREYGPGAARIRVERQEEERAAHA